MDKKELSKELLSNYVCVHVVSIGLFGSIIGILKDSPVIALVCILLVMVFSILLKIGDKKVKQLCEL